MSTLVDRGVEGGKGVGRGHPQTKEQAYGLICSICPSTEATNFHEVGNLLPMVQDNKCVVILVRNLLLSTEVDSDVCMIKWNKLPPLFSDIT